jgi:hypothetical protein
MKLHFSVFRKKTKTFPKIIIFEKKKKVLFLTLFYFFSSSSSNLNVHPGNIQPHSFSEIYEWSFDLPLIGWISELD